MEGYYDIKIGSNNSFKLDDVRGKVRHLISSLYDDENIGLYNIVTFGTNNYKFNANENNSDLLFDTLPNIIDGIPVEYQSIKLFFRDIY